MKKNILRNISALVIAALTSLSASALTLEGVSAGQLAGLVGSNVDAKELSLKGTIDVRDIDFIAAKMTALEKLDISGVHIAAYKGFRALSQQSSFESKTLPALAFAGLAIRELSLPDELTAIGDGALAHLPIEKLTLPTSLRTIGDGAMSGCAKLASIEISDGVKTIGVGAFSRCTSLKKLVFNGRKVSAEAFRGCTSLETASFGSRLENIGERAFADCSALTTVSFAGDALRGLGDEAFRGTALKAIDLSGQGNFNTLGAWALANIEALKSVKVPQSLRTIGDAAFFNDAAFNVYDFSRGVTSIGEAAYKGIGLDNSEENNIYFLHEHLKELPPYALYGMSAIKKIHLPADLEYIGDHAMDGMSSLRQMSAPSITAVPALGEEVWGDLDKATVKVGVPDDLIEAFKAAEEWRDFRIVSATNEPPEDSLDDIFADAAPSLDARFEGMVLNVVSDAPIAWVELYDTLGRRLYASGNLASDTHAVAIDTSRFDTRLYIVRTPGASLKLIR